MTGHDAAGGARILVVDDEPAIRDMLKMLLEIEGYVVATACDGVQALERLAREPCDLVVTDLMMPKMDGDEFAQRLRADAGLAALPVLLTTATTARSGAVDRLFDACLAKPYDLPRLLAMIQSLLQQDAARPAGRAAR